MSEDQKEETNGSEFSTRLRWGAATDVGRVRSANEDSWLIDYPLFAVADGMGGHAAGEVAVEARARHAAHLGHRPTRSSRSSRR